jgi:transcriptional regulator with XRE-family HTH domain
MNGEPLLAKYDEEFADDPDYVVAGLYIDFMEGVCAHMKDHGVSQAELARRMRVSQARVSSLFRDTGNLTFRTMAKMLIALEADAQVRVVPRARTESGGWGASMREPIAGSADVITPWPEGMPWLPATELTREVSHEREGYPVPTAA